MSDQCFILYTCKLGVRKYQGEATVGTDFTSELLQPESPAYKQQELALVNKACVTLHIQYIYIQIVEYRKPNPLKCIYMYLQSSLI